METSNGTRPGIKSENTLDRAPRLSGQLSGEGVASLKVDATSRQNGAAEVNTLNGTASVHNMDGTRDSPPTEEEAEDYDDVRPEADALIDGSHGGDLEVDLDKKEEATAEDLVRRTRRRSIPIRLEKTDKRGRYLLHADDPVIRELLRQGMEKQRKTAPVQRTSVRDLVFTRRFTTFDRQNAKSHESPFFGFFTLFWIAMALLLLRVAAQNYRTYGSVVGTNEIVKMMLSKDVLLFGVTDGVLCGSTGFGLVLQWMVLKGWIDWEGMGYIIENIWQSFYIAGFVGWTFYRDWPWTHTIFIVLHGMVFLMKQHSYSFYNGYLSQIYKRKQNLERKLFELQTMDETGSPPSSPDRASLTPNTPDATLTSTLRHRRKSSTNAATPSDEIASISHQISTHQPLTSQQMTTFSTLLRQEITSLSIELRGKCTATSNAYPRNLTLANFAEWTCLPTLVYELEYPRQRHINWLYVLEKTVATFGVIFVMMVISQAYIYPPVAETVRMKDAGLPVTQRWAAFPWIVSDMLFPLLLEQLLTWYVIWECVLNVLAELTRFADRGFYGDWWNSTSWDQYARDWNRPVHNFLLRHVYHSSISALRLSKGTATFVTFLLSALVHELVMFCLFKKVRGYLFASQLLQMPLVMVSRTRVVKEWRVMGNVVFWIGLFVGPSFLTSLYLVV